MDSGVRKILDDNYKKCAHCKKTKHLDEFNYRKDTPDKKQYHCRSCGIRRNDKYYNRSKDAHISRAKKRKELIAAQTPGCKAFADYAYGFYMTEAKLLYLKDGIPREVDHIISISDGGYHHIDNFQLLTKSENRSKGAESWSMDDPRLENNKLFQELIKSRWLSEDRCGCEHCQAMRRDVEETKERRRRRHKKKMEALLDG